MIWRLAAFAASVLWASAVEAREEESPRGIKPLSLEEVLASVDATHPVLAAAEQSVRQAEGKQLAARGAWDPELRAQGTWTPVGHYEVA